jgi:hypothetical protein
VSIEYRDNVMPNNVMPNTVMLSAILSASPHSGLKAKGVVEARGGFLKSPLTQLFTRK